MMCALMASYLQESYVCTRVESLGTLSPGPGNVAGEVVYNKADHKADQTIIQGYPVISGFNQP
jgi:hypothetical protein